MRPLIFLDIDGVLNTSKNYAEWRASTAQRGIPQDDDPHVLKLFEKSSVDVLNAIVAEHDAQIFVSSSWRHFYARDFEKLRGILERAGVKGLITGPTPCRIMERYSAIRAVLEGHARVCLPGGSTVVVEPVHVLILDDEYPETFGPDARYHLPVNPETGLVSAHIEVARRILALEWQPSFTIRDLRQRKERCDDE